MSGGVVGLTARRGFSPWGLCPPPHGRPSIPGTRAIDPPCTTSNPDGHPPDLVAGGRLDGEHGVVRARHSPRQSTQEQRRGAALHLHAPGGPGRGVLRGVPHGWGSCNATHRRRGGVRAWPGPRRIHAQKGNRRRCRARARRPCQPRPPPHHRASSNPTRTLAVTEKCQCGAARKAENRYSTSAASLGRSGVQGRPSCVPPESHSYAATHEPSAVASRGGRERR